MKGALVIPKLMYINFYAEKINKKASTRLACVIAREKLAQGFKSFNAL